MSLAERETPQQALQRIRSMGFGKNDETVIVEFAERGIDPAEIDPRGNVLTYRAWKAEGRQVAKGAISVPVTVWIPKRGESDDTPPEERKDGVKKSGCYPKTTRLFHVSQTIAKDSPKGTKPAAWQNPQLIRPDTYDDDEGTGAVDVPPALPPHQPPSLDDLLPRHPQC